MKLESFITGMLIIGLVSSLSILFLAGVYSSYSTEFTMSDYNDTKFSGMQQTSSLISTMNETKGKIDQITSEESSLYDKLSGLIGGTVGAAKTLFQTEQVASGLLNEGVDSAKLGDSGTLLKATGIALLLLGVIAGIIALYLKVGEI